ncbi:DNA polymerase III subunit delta' [Shimia abyssi]|uniref:DNA polymerase III delta prime subunit n=1 Tax=Shimia abyssi TaxID=1662395 RepID=A0A2P8FBB5_9RHOB|nr:DNA polymerase III subunit delta' [Shimia abyssi]PSL18978.1 DNA polymerase III delta prime subunit [Shimia abyssi]
MSDDQTPEADRVDGAPHPRDTQTLFGQQCAIDTFLTALNADRLHHGWLITGPLGVGKATLAWQIARFLLATSDEADGGLFGGPPQYDSLLVDPEHPVARRIAARSEPGLYAITRSVNEKTGRLRDQIVIDDVRGLTHFLHMSASDGGRRVVIVDSADEMNPNAANGLLKMLEEPPARTTLLLISHQPSRLLPTIRSRCRELRLSPLSPEDMHDALIQAQAEVQETPALAELAAGSVGEAMRILRLDGLEIYNQLVQLFATMPRFDRPRALALAETAAQRGAADKFELLLTLLDIFISRTARTGATGHPPMTEAAPGEAELLMRLAPDPLRARAWATTAQEISERSRHGRAVNLDPAALVLDTVFKIQKTASA